MRENAEISMLWKITPDRSIVTIDIRSNYKAVKKYSKKLQIALANDLIKWYSIHKPAGALFCVPKNRREKSIINFLIYNSKQSKGETT